MTDNEFAEEVDGPGALRRLRQADVVTGLVLAVVAAGMVAKALTFPLEGTYAGVKNAWYVSPALLPLIIGGMLFVLSIGLAANGVREARRLSARGRLLGAEGAAAPGHGSSALLVTSLLAFFIVGLVPRADFVIAMALYLLVFMGVYALKSWTGRALLIACLGVPAVVALAVALAGAWPTPRSPGQFQADAVLAAVLGIAILVLLGFARPAERGRAFTVVASALGTAVVLAAAFKYGLLVPLPREGLGVGLLDGAANGLSGLFR